MEKIESGFYQHPVITYISYRLHKYNQNFVCTIVGGTGSGKSYAALRLAETIDANFNINNVVFTAKDFMELLVNGKKNGRIRKGSVIIFDEAGVGIPAREWQKLLNKLMGYIFQTFRIDNICVIFTTPAFSFVDVQVRKLMHMKIETVTILREHNICLVKPLLMQYNDRFDDVYYKYYQVNRKRVTRMKLGLPSEKLRSDYETAHVEYKHKLQEEILREFQKQEEANAPKEKVETKSLDDIGLELSESNGDFKTRTGKWNVSKIQAVYNLGRRNAAVAAEKADIIMASA